MCILTAPRTIGQCADRLHNCNCYYKCRGKPTTTGATPFFANIDAAAENEEDLDEVDAVATIVIAFVLTTAIVAVFVVLIIRAVSSSERGSNK